MNTAIGIGHWKGKKIFLAEVGSGVALLLLVLLTVSSISASTVYSLLADIRLGKEVDQKLNFTFGLFSRSFFSVSQLY